jgi:hypothetical protein
VGVNLNDPSCLAGTAMHAAGIGEFMEHSCQTSRVPKGQTLNVSFQDVSRFSDLLT